MREDSTHLGVLWGIWRRFDVQVRSGFPPDPSRSCTRRPRSCCSANTASWERRFNVYYMLGAISNSGLTCCFRRTVEREPARWAAGRRCSRRSPTSTSSRGWYTPTRAGTSAVSSISCCKRNQCLWGGGWPFVTGCGNCLWNNARPVLFIVAHQIYASSEQFSFVLTHQAAVFRIFHELPHIFDQIFKRFRPLLSLGVTCIHPPYWLRVPSSGAWDRSVPKKTKHSQQKSIPDNSCIIKPTP